MDKEKELTFLEALYLIQKTALFDFGNISIGKKPDKDTEIYQKAFEGSKK